MTPTASVTPSPTATACLDQLEVVLRQGLAESSLAALQSLPAGAPAEAGWRVRNTGTCTWDSAYGLAPTDGGSPQFLTQRVRPGDLLDLSVSFSIPPRPGAHTLFWELRNGRGQPVGDPLAINVLAADLPVPTLPPGLTLRAYPQVIQPDERTTISWNVSEAREVYFYQPGQTWQQHPVDAIGNVYDFPTRDTTYELRVVRGDDSVEIYRVRVEVAPYEPPVIVYFRPQPDSLATPTGCVALEWLIRGRLSLLVITRDGEAIYTGGREQAAGVLRDCPIGVGRYVYTLQVYGPGGSGDCQASYTYQK